ncbi:MAG: dynamin family protein [Nocardia sp.]|nr:dynamin family protein [Nocardia sp.]
MCSAVVADTADTPVPPLTRTLDETISAARFADREDLVGRLEALACRIRDPRRRIVVAGLGNQGKSSFVNALLNIDVSPVGDDTATGVPVTLEQGRQPRAQIVVAEYGDRTRNIPIPIEDIHTVTPRSPHGRVLRVEVELPNPMLADGIVVVDTPPVGGHITATAAAVLALAPAADAVLVVSDAATELTESEVDLLRQVRQLCPAVALVLSKIDLYPHWRQVAEADRQSLRRHRLMMPLVPVSSLVRAHAVRRQDLRLARESGFGPLFEFLREQVVARDEAAAQRTVALDIHAAAEHLALALSSELVARRDPERAAAIEELRTAGARAEDLHRRTAPWQRTLGDGITDLAGEIDHDLRERLNTIGAAAQHWIDRHDPGRQWNRFEQWLTQATGTAIGDNLLWTHHRAIHLAERVAGHFLDFGALELPAVRGDSGPDHWQLSTVTLAELEPDLGLGHKMLVGMRGSYGGMVMAGLVGSVAGLALIDPVSLPSGVPLGGKVLREAGASPRGGAVSDRSADDRESLMRRRGEANSAVRRYLDDVAVEAGKESRDRLRRVHGVLRDHFTGIAGRSLRSIDDALRAARAATDAHTGLESERRAELESRLRQLAALRDHADAILPTAPASRTRPPR